jgi:hypothetical protein
MQEHPFIGKILPATVYALSPTYDQALWASTPQVETIFDVFSGSRQTEYFDSIKEDVEQGRPVHCSIRISTHDTAVLAIPEDPPPQKDLYWFDINLRKRSLRHILGRHIQSNSGVVQRSIRHLDYNPDYPILALEENALTAHKRGYQPLEILDPSDGVNFTLDDFTTSIIEFMEGKYDHPVKESLVLINSSSKHHKIR